MGGVENTVPVTFKNVFLSQQVTEPTSECRPGSRSACALQVPSPSPGWPWPYAPKFFKSFFPFVIEFSLVVLRTSTDISIRTEF